MSDGPLKPRFQRFLNKVFPDFSSKRRNRILIKRIRKLGQNTKFSTRERWYLKKLLREQRDSKELKYSKFEYHFPGKTINAIKEEIKSVSNL